MSCVSRSTTKKLIVFSNGRTAQFTYPSLCKKRNHYKKKSRELTVFADTFKSIRSDCHPHLLLACSHSYMYRYYFFYWMNVRYIYGVRKNCPKSFNHSSEAKKKLSLESFFFFFESCHKHSENIYLNSLLYIEHRPIIFYEKSMQSNQQKTISVEKKKVPKTLLAYPKK